ncbi:MAG TPA: hypothetical protein DF774_01640 [Rheinheimera sp.]|uniref:capsule assembly Wzi family protein n=1 Tax=Rheinheimera sp. TaxID=1869214 RepID=UPI000ECD2A9D|nr:capsule assembly Wzi family protein [Rheinheimera sp.]HCU64442.1 hypothetical protein [Rheinheimera sp.]
MKKLVVACALALSGTASATPWLDTSDNSLRQSLQTLAQAGVLTGPVNTYPIMWKNIAIDLNQLDINTLSPELRFAALHLSAALAANRAQQTSGLKLKLNSAPSPAQNFGEDYFEKAAATFFSEYQDDRWAGRLQVSQRRTEEGSQEQDTVYDGSYLAAIMGNWVLSFDQNSQWWGPGQQSSLLLSNNARPLPSVRLSRHSWRADQRPWLNWLGPWSISTFVGRGQHNSSIANVKYWGGRATVRPISALELGVSRTVQWGGEGQSNSFSTMWDLISYDRRDEIQADQRAALDLSYHFNAFSLPLTLYAEIADDDNSSGLPDKALQLYGVRTFWGEAQALHSLNLEYSDSYLQCEDSLAPGHCAYQGHWYPEGYRRYGRIIGSGYGADAKVLSSGYVYQLPDGQNWSAQLAYASYYQGLQSDSSWQLKLQHQRPLFSGLLQLQSRFLQKSPLRPELEKSLSVAASWEYRY